MNTRKTLSIGILAGIGLLIYLGLTASGQAPPKAAAELPKDKSALEKDKTPDKDKAADKEKTPEKEKALVKDNSALEKQIIATAEAYTKSFNAADAKAIADEYLIDGELVDGDGDVFQGRDAIEKEMAAYFEATPGVKIKVKVEAVRPVGADIAIEDGTATITTPNDGPVTVGKYTAFHVQRDGKWKLASVHTFETENATPHDQLKQLDWLLGDWVDESPDATVRHHCEWSDDGNFLLVNFEAEFAGHKKLKGTQRIGWDPLYKQLRSWIFDASGSFAEGHWTFLEDRWVVKVTGVRPDGAVATSTNIYAPIDKDRFTWSSTDRVVGGEQEADVTVLIVRKPPPPIAP